MHTRLLSEVEELTVSGQIRVFDGVKGRIFYIDWEFGTFEEKIRSFMENKCNFIIEGSNN